MTRVLTVAGSDSSGGAGIQADLRAFADLGVTGLTAVTAVTAQGPRGVAGWWPVDVDGVRAQIRAALPVDAVKVGMLGSAAVARAVAEEVAGLGVPVVVDPVGAATSGGSLLGPGALEVLRDSVIRLATVVTPNLDEVALLTGVTGDQQVGAEAVHRLGCRWVLVTGGHLPGDPVDLLWDGHSAVTYRGVRRPEARGTGCRLAAAIAVGLGRGADVPDAVADARDYLVASWRA